MTNYMINGNAVKEITITMPDGKKVTITPNDEIVHEDIVLLPRGGRGGEFTHDMPVISQRGKNDAYLVTDAPVVDHTVNYSHNGEGPRVPLIHIQGERANG